MGLGLRCRCRPRSLERLAHTHQLAWDRDFNFIWKWLGGDLDISQLAIKRRQFATQVHDAQFRKRAAMIAKETFGLCNQSPTDSFSLQIRLDGKHSDSSDSRGDFASHLAEDCALKSAIRLQQQEGSSAQG